MPIWLTPHTAIRCRNASGVKTIAFKIQLLQIFSRFFLKGLLHCSGRPSTMVHAVGIRRQIAATMAAQIFKLGKRSNVPRKSCGKENSGFERVPNHIAQAPLPCTLARTPVAVALSCGCTKIRACSSSALAQKGSNLGEDNSSSPCTVPPMAAPRNPSALRLLPIVGPPVRELQRHGGKGHKTVRVVAHIAASFSFWRFTNRLARSRSAEYQNELMLNA